MKKKTLEDQALDYCERRYGFNTHEMDAFSAGYQAGVKAVKEKLAAMGIELFFGTPEDTDEVPFMWQ
jgi:hypothetical protein